jgi:hypothetical protein
VSEWKGGRKGEMGGNGGESVVLVLALVNEFIDALRSACVSE